MSIKADLANRSILFIAYHYPPVGGTGTPGTLRAVKFIRRFENAEIHVLTAARECYPCNLPLNFNVPLPVNGEHIHRSKTFDIFKILLNFRMFWLKIFSRVKGFKHKSQFEDIVFPDAEEDFPENKNGKSFWKKIKDFIYNVCYFPDQASSWILFAFLKGINVVRNKKVDVIFATGMPWSCFVVGWLLHLITRRPLIVDFRDPWVGNPAHLSKGRLFDWLIKFFEKRIVTSSTVVCVNTDAVRDDFKSRYPKISDDKFVVLTNGFDMDMFTGVLSTSKSKGDQSFLDLFHTGFFYGYQDPRPILDAIRLINNENSWAKGRVRFTQIGFIRLNYNINKSYSDLIASGQLVIKNEVPYQECLKAMAGADVLVTTLAGGTRTQIPSKLYDYLAINRPILNVTAKDSALGDLVSRHGFGDLVEWGNVEAISQHLLALLEKKGNGGLRADYPDRMKFEIGSIAKKLGECICSASS